jgi:hypothetical protein
VAPFLVAVKTPGLAAGTMGRLSLAGAGLAGAGAGAGAEAGAAAGSAARQSEVEAQSAARAKPVAILRFMSSLPVLFF